MHKKLLLPRYTGIALTLLVMANTSAHADLISWGYNWTPSTTKVAANAGGSGYLGLTNEPPNSATGSSNTVVTNVHTVSTAPYNTPDTFSHAAISFAFQLTDSASKATAILKFSGSFSGTITGDSSNILLTMNTPTQKVTLGGNTYAVTMGNYTAPGPSNAVNFGSLNAFVTVTPGNNGGGVVSGVPEPSTAMLAGLTLPCLGWFQWRKRRVRKATA